MLHMPQENFQIALLVPLLQKKSAIFSIEFKLNCISESKICFSQGRTYREGALLRYSCRRGAYYSGGRTNR